MIILLNGALGVGKTETSWALLEKFDRAVMLDGDYLGAVHPFEIHDAARVEYLHRTLIHLIQFHRQNGYRNFVINYVFEKPETLARLRRKLIELDDRVRVYRLVCDAAEHARRVRARGGNRLEWELARAEELTAIQNAAALRGDLGTPVDTTGLSVAQVVDAIWAHIRQPVEIAPYNPAWADEFAAEAARVRAALGSLAVNIHHIGSTAVPGLDAKPIVDMMVTVRKLDDARACIASLAELGYIFVDQPQNTARRFFKKGDPRTHHLHIVESGGDAEWRHVAFRDALRADDRLRD
ncbi:MAG TPA: hypothetical protein ENJ48_02905, partial [Anaerolineae bacterium]|nr:hypothetical protein [Anaerolineae bacterium]